MMIAPPRNESWDPQGAMRFSSAAIVVDGLSGDFPIVKLEVDWDLVMQDLRALFGYVEASELAAAGNLRMLGLGDWLEHSSIGQRALESGHQICEWSDRSLRRLEQISRGERLLPAEYRDLVVFLANVSLALGEGHPGLPLPPPDPTKRY